MLIKGRGDVFPRSVLEVETELNTFKDEAGANLTIVPHFLLQYPSAIYFFFSKEKPEIAQAVEKGLAIMRKNGEFDRLFKAYHRSAIEHADIKNKIIIKLKNKQLPALTPLNDASLWFSEKDI
jgi:lysyl-tRNA synthetase class I